MPVHRTGAKLPPEGAGVLAARPGIPGIRTPGARICTSLLSPVESGLRRSQAQPTLRAARSRMVLGVTGAAGKGARRGRIAATTFSPGPRAVIPTRRTQGHPPGVLQVLLIAIRRGTDSLGPLLERGRAMRRVWAVSLLLAAIGSAPLGAQQLIVGSGARLQLGSSTVDAGCRNLAIAGTLDLGSGQLTGARDVQASGALLGGSGTLALNGDLAAATALQPQSGTVRIGDGCDRGSSLLTGAHQFNRLVVDIAGDHTLWLPANQTQVIAQGLTLDGGTQRLLMQSSSLGQVGFLALANGGSQAVNRVDAIDVGAPPTAQFLAPNLPAVYDSIDRGNTPRFFADQPVLPVPTQSPFSMIVLLAALMLAGARQLASRGN